MNIFKKIVLAACVVVAGFSTGAQASLIGDTITVAGSNLGTTTTAAIGTGNEFSISNSIFFNFDASTLTITTPGRSYTWGNLGSYVFSGFDDTITNVTFASEQNFGSGRSDFLSDFQFTAHSITFNLSGGSSQNGNSALVFNIVTTPASSDTTPVPEPTSVALVGLGLLGFAASRRKVAKK